MTAIPRVVRNDWSPVRVPDVGDWRPELSVSVIVPAFNCQASLDLTLASLSRQTYPADLLEVVVVDDGSTPALRLPEIRPANTRLLAATELSKGWGKSNALNLGVAESTGDILHLLDADMLVFPEHIEAQVRWQHRLPYAVTLGYKRFVDTAPGVPSWPTAAAVADACGRGAPEELFAGLESLPHDYVERYIDDTDQLCTADHQAFRIHVGATVALRREMYEAAGGFDTDLRLGEDTEFGYRLTQAGAVFVPEPRSRSWHLGLTRVMRVKEQVQRYSRPFLADRMPHPRWLRHGGGTGWTIPLVTVVLDVTDEPLERARVAVDSTLIGDLRDVRVCLVGPWHRLDDGRAQVLTDPLLDLRLIAATYQGEPRVRLVERAPESVFPCPYLVEAPATAGFAPSALSRLVELADRYQVGLVRVLPDGGADGPTVRLWRTAALARAAWVRADGEPLDEAVTEVYGSRAVEPDLVGVVDLRAFDTTQLGTGARTLLDVRPGRWMPEVVEVGGVRSLLRAMVVVAAAIGRRGVDRLRWWARRWSRRSVAGRDGSP